MRSTAQSLAALALVTLAAAGCSLRGGDDSREATAILLDEHEGAYGPVFLGSSVQDLRRAFGAPAEGGRFTGPEFTGPNQLRNPVQVPIPPIKLEFEQATFWLWDSLGIYAITTRAEGAETQARVGVGDSLELIRERYDRVRCGESPHGGIWLDEPSTYPWCMTRVGEIDLYFGGDPIKSMTIARAGLINI